MSRYIVRNCEWCGAPIDPEEQKKHYKKFCSEECAIMAHSKHNTETCLHPKRFAQREMAKIKTGVLDRRMAEAKEKGMTYSEYKKQLTLARARNNG